MAEMRTLKQAMAVMNMIDRYAEVTLRRPFKLDALPEGYLAGHARYEGLDRELHFGISPEGEVSS